jgi:uncharacterized membrane protein YqiK
MLGAGLALMAIVIVVVLVVALLFIARSVHRIGPTEVGLVTRRMGARRLAEDNPVAFAGEAGYQAELLMPGMRFKPWPAYTVTKFPWVQVPAGEIGVVIAQVGRPLPIGAKSARYRPEFGNFVDLRGFLAAGGEKGVQRPVLPPGSLVPIHPVAFLVLTAPTHLRHAGLAGTVYVGGTPGTDTGIVRARSRAAPGGGHRATR